MRLDAFTLIVPYYRNVSMLQLQLHAFCEYDKRIRIIVVDDCSPEPASLVVEYSGLTRVLGDRFSLYRVTTDIPWNRGGARNLGAWFCKTQWLMHMDIDHVLSPHFAQQMLDTDVDHRSWYRFVRFRVGEADETRNKDALPREQKFGAVKPHIDSYLCTKKRYWAVGGYDEDYSGCLGGGSPFLQQMTAFSPPQMMPEGIWLKVYTRNACHDASDMSLSRDTAEYSRRRKAKEAAGNVKARNPLRFQWERVL